MLPGDATTGQVASRSEVSVGRSADKNDASSSQLDSFQLPDRSTRIENTADDKTRGWSRGRGGAHHSRPEVESEPARDEHGVAYGNDDGRTCARHGDGREFAGDREQLCDPASCGRVSRTALSRALLPRKQAFLVTRCRQDEWKDCEALIMERRVQLVEVCCSPLSNLTEEMRKRCGTESAERLSIWNGYDLTRHGESVKARARRQELRPRFFVGINAVYCLQYHAKDQPADARATETAVLEAEEESHDLQACGTDGV